MKQAVVLIHGIGEQVPMDTLRGFVRAVWITDENVRKRGKQIKALEALRGAAANFHDAAFDRKINVLKVGLDLASGSIGAAGKTILEQKNARIAVGAVSFASHLTKIFRNELENESRLLWKHLSPVGASRIRPLVPFVLPAT